MKPTLMTSTRPLSDDDDDVHGGPDYFPLPPKSPAYSNSPTLRASSRTNLMSPVEMKEKDYELSRLPSSRSSPTEEERKWPAAVPGITFVNERQVSQSSDGHQPSFAFPEPHALAPALARQPNNRSLNDLYAESPRASPSPYASRRSSWQTNPHQSYHNDRSSWQQYGDDNSPYGAPTPVQGSEIFRPLVHDAPSQIFEKEWHKEGTIARIHERDDVEHMASWKRYLYYCAPFLALLTLASYWTYFGLRIYCVIAAQNQEHRTFPLAWIFVGIEISVAIPVFMQSFWTIFILKKRHRPKLRLIGNQVPSVDVFVTVCGEEVDLIMDTVRAACDVDYPADSFRVVVLDDGKDAALQEAVEGLARTYPNCFYRARIKIKGVPHHFKAGNLNYGLDEVHNMPGGASELVAALDADMIPEQSWLRAVVPHIMDDPKCALACPPQLFYNVPPGDPLCQSLDFFVHVSEPIKDALGVAWCTGSGYVLRREAIDQIGQFPKGSLAEDVATSTLMLGLGWKTAYIHEPLQFGTVPDSYGSHLKQRTRWAIGTVDTSLKLKFCLYGDAVRQMTAFQRMSSFIYAFLSFLNILLVISLFALPIVLITGNALVAYASDNQLRWLVRACAISFLCNRLCEVVLFLPAGYNCGQRGSRAQLWMAPYIALTIIRSFVLPTWLGGQTQAFKPSGSLKSELNERDPHHRAGLFRRLKVIVVNYLAGYHILYVYFCLTAVTLTTLRCLVDQYTVRDQLKCLLTHAFWPPLAWIMVVSAFWVPVTYAFDPPNMPDREDLLDRDPKTGIAHPTKESKKTAFKPQTAFFELEYAVSTLFTIFVFGAAFFY